MYQGGFVLSFGISQQFAGLCEVAERGAEVGADFIQPLQVVCRGAGDVPFAGGGEGFDFPFSHAGGGRGWPGRGCGLAGRWFLSGFRGGFIGLVQGRCLANSADLREPVVERDQVHGCGFRGVPGGLDGGCLVFGGTGFGTGDCRDGSGEDFRGICQGGQGKGRGGRYRAGVVGDFEVGGIAGGQVAVGECIGQRIRIQGDFARAGGGWLGSGTEGVG